MDDALIYGGPLLFLAIWWIVLNLTARLTGWSKLAAHYRSDDVFHGRTWKFQSVGTRFGGGYNNAVRYRKVGIDVFTFLWNLGIREKITAGQSCSRVHSKRALETLALTEDGFGFSVETLVQAREADLRIAEAYISCIYHEKRHSMNPMLNGLGVALMVVKRRALVVSGYWGGQKS